MEIPFDSEESPIKFKVAVIKTKEPEPENLRGTPIE